jgi:hypothetical protein
MPFVTAEYAFAIQAMPFRATQGIMRTWRKNSNPVLSR